MPYVLDLSGDYLDPIFRARAKQEFTAFIKRFENYGSLLMWNFDDEPLDNMIVRLRTPPEQVAAFSDFLLELAEHATARTAIIVPVGSKNRETGIWIYFKHH